MQKPEIFLGLPGLPGLLMLHKPQRLATPIIPPHPLSTYLVYAVLSEKIGVDVAWQRPSNPHQLFPKDEHSNHHLTGVKRRGWGMPGCS